MKLISKNEKIYSWLGLSCAISLTLYCFFYAIAGYVRKLNQVIDPNLLSPPLRAWYLLPRDGMEPWTLYIIMTVLVLITLLIARVQWKPEYIKIFSKISTYLILPILILSMIVRVPPVANIMTSEINIITMVLYIGMIAVITLISRYSVNFFKIIVIATIMVLCITTTSSLSKFDYNFILIPALKIFNGAALHSTYFQYDLLLSLIVLPFLWCDIDPYLVQIVFQLSYFIFFLAIYKFSKSFFNRKDLALFLLIGVIVCRFYAIQYDPTFAFQLTPLRLDLWLILIILAWRFGVYHWTVGLSIATLVIIHRNFGTIYFAAYIMLLLICELDSMYDLIGFWRTKRQNSVWIKDSLIRFTKAIILPALGFLLSLVIFRDLGLSEAAKLYASYGFGFDAINRSSYYWYVPVIICFAIFLLFNMRSMLDKKYISCSYFLIFIVIGNSLYFFGRSHESNILAISGSIILLVFLIIDLLSKYICDDQNIFIFRNNINNIFQLNNLIYLLPIIFTFLAIFYYSQRIYEKIDIQLNNILSKKIHHKITHDIDLTSIYKITNGSSKVFPMLFSEEFFFYYTSGNRVKSYWAPYAAWLYKDNQIEFLQSLLDQGYYLIYDFSDDNYVDGQKEILHDLKFNKEVKVHNYGVIYKQH